nr:MAG TPA: hypothetical protein [Bacteriophage sp.]
MSKNHFISFFQHKIHFSRKKQSISCSIFSSFFIKIFYKTKKIFNTKISRNSLNFLRHKNCADISVQRLCEIKLTVYIIVIITILKEKSRKKN